jgi:hypothetical protein
MKLKYPTNLRTVEVYDSFKPNRLLEVRFELSEKPEYVKTFRSAYASTYELLEKVVWKDTKRELVRGLV